jgi:hypothetical protein
MSGMEGVIPVPGDEIDDEAEGGSSDDQEGDSADEGNKEEIWGSDVSSGNEWEPSDWGR